MEFYTIQMASHREAKRLGIPFVDITRKSGEFIFAPTWEMIRALKDGRMSAAEYTEKYEELMAHTYNLYREDWYRFFQRDKVAVACFCGAGTFCHRYLLRNILKRVFRNRGWDFIDGGEITKETFLIPHPPSRAQQGLLDFDVGGMAPSPA